MVRENVFAPDAKDFSACLELLGYRTIALGFNSADFTSQNRQRQFIVGCPDERIAAAFQRALLDTADDIGINSPCSEEKKVLAACLTAHPCRMAAEDNYCFESEIKRLRILSPEECERLQGFPVDWTAGFSSNRRRIMLGNAVTVPIIKWIAERIKETINESNENRTDGL